MCTKVVHNDEVSPHAWMKCASHMYLMGVHLHSSSDHEVTTHLVSAYFAHFSASPALLFQSEITFKKAPQPDISDLPSKTCTSIGVKKGFSHHILPFSELFMFFVDSDNKYPIETLKIIAEIEG